MKQFCAESAGAVLAVRQSRDDGEPLLLLHGGPGVPDYLQAATAPMLPRFRCISFDQRGTGQSACRDGRYELPAYLDDIEATRAEGLLGPGRGPGPQDDAPALADRRDSG
jgi:proline iminopeptidase